MKTLKKIIAWPFKVIGVSLAFIGFLFIAVYAAALGEEKLDKFCDCLYKMAESIEKR